MSKKRPVSHITGDKGIDIVKSVLPSEWVIRTLTPDYGIDLLVELFDFVDDKKKVCETLGEFLYLQVKGTENLERRKLRVHPVYNVAKSEWDENKDEFMDIDIVSFPIDTSLLETVKRVGTSVCVLLFVVDTTTKEVFSICLSDVLDKYIQPQKPDYKKQDSVTIHIPIDNKVDGTFYSLVPIRMYGKRSKLYSAFSFFRYQLKELRREISQPEIAFLNSNPESGKELDFVTNKLSEFVLFFAEQVLELDIWSIGDHLLALGLCKLNLDSLIADIKTGKLNNYHVLIMRSIHVWEQLDNMGSIYEEICREWFLPKFIGQLSSYPNSPEIKTKQ